jgi:benzoyl-CoA reductase/2-hydroxyglutaryl-CoA dehydratase subunit BcrC/BadD/HgdB
MALLEGVASFLVILAVGSFAGLGTGWFILSQMGKREKIEGAGEDDMRGKRYATKALLSNLSLNKEKAEATARSQITLARANLGKQQGRPTAMEYYDDIFAFDRGRIDEVRAFRSAGGKVVGFFCLFVPIELVRACGALPLRVDSGLFSGVALSEQLLPSEVCPVVKSALGAEMLELSPYLSLCDVVVCPSSCGMKAKLGEILEDFAPIWRIEVPTCKDASPTKRTWLAEINALKQNLEKLTGQEITRETLRRSIESAQDARAVFHRLRELRKCKTPPISGRDAMLITQAIWYDDLERWTEKTKQLCSELEKRIEDHLNVGYSEAPRIMLAGSPIIWPNWKLPDLIEDSGGVIVCDELCSGDQGVLGDSVNVDEWTMKDMLAAIADRYLQPVTCPCFTPNDKRVDRIARMVKDFGVDGVVYHQLRGCYVHKIEFASIRTALSNLRVPVLGIETDYTHEDLGQMRTRIEAFLEMIQTAKQNYRPT